MLQEGNDGTHKIGSVLNPCQDIKNEHKVRWLRPDWPALGPDLSPIERVWKILHQRIKKRKARTQAELEALRLEEWDKITQAKTDKETNKEVEVLNHIYYYLLYYTVCCGCNGVC